MTKPNAFIGEIFDTQKCLITRPKLNWPRQRFALTGLAG